jgi:bifunctional UDP-N-acetylglucosamine pyrophosphorylase/glucosamine-1-phosphate N-acetyltransferase
VLPDLTPHNEQGEYYLTDTLALLRERGRAPAVLCASDYRELLGINTVEQLAEAEGLWLAMETSKGEPHGE